MGTIVEDLIEIDEQYSRIVGNADFLDAFIC